MTAIEQARAADRYAPPAEPSDDNASPAELRARATYRHACIHEAMMARDSAEANRHEREMERLFKLAAERERAA